MGGFLIALSIAICIFFIVSITVLIRRQQKAKQSVGYVISEGTPVAITSATHRPPGGAPVTHYPPPSYQANVYPGTYAYPARTTSHVQMIPVQVQVMPTPMPGMQTSYPPMQQRAVNNGTMSNADLTVLPANCEKPITHQTHQGAVETVSQI
ncbi:uncharacterized protein LOC115762775 [Drosophila novamexicana]|uniref:uncharacterized protein LOC115762775 n=1 Tax=Drosophila novamexicana TaxID=47314 RepID=UPI0011E5D7A8|nr:uncharacterized protein LOC115762775 [Drosophila novamexicana]